MPSGGHGGESGSTVVPQRDPQTGKFVSGDSYDDYEVITFDAAVGVEAADLNGGTGFAGQSEFYNGLEIIDYDEVVDRNERLDLLRAEHRLLVYANSTETADGTVVASAEISSAPTITDVGAVRQDQTDVDGGPVVGEGRQDDTIDLLGRPLVGAGYGPFSDSSTGVGGAGSSMHDRVVIHNPPGPIGTFHPRDELFVNGEIDAWNIDDAGVHLDIKGQHVYGVSTQ